MTIHEWVYKVVCDVCYDREYVYASFVRHFGFLMQEILEKGRFAESGTYVVPGMKSDLKATFTWQLESCIDLVRLNAVKISCVIESTYMGAAEPEESYWFELSTGEQIPERSI